MRKCGIENRPKIVVQKVVCDDCGNDCTNTTFEIVAKTSFMNELIHIEDLCWKCYDKKYANKKKDPILKE